MDQHTTPPPAIYSGKVHRLDLDLVKLSAAVNAANTTWQEVVTAPDGSTRIACLRRYIAAIDNVLQQVEKQIETQKQ